MPAASPLARPEAFLAEEFVAAIFIIGAFSVLFATCLQLATLVDTLITVEVLAAIRVTGAMVKFPSTLLFPATLLDTLVTEEILAALRVLGTLVAVLVAICPSSEMFAEFHEL